MNMMEKDFLKFFLDLKKNNNREWFADNKDRYERVVKGPFEGLVAELIRALSKEDKALAIEPKDAIFRIYRDTRFSKDKTPYKEYASAAIAPGGRKDMTYPGLYIQAGANSFGLAGGVYMPDKEQLEDIRAAIAHDPRGWKKAVSDKKFAATWGGIQGERNKILKGDYKTLMADIPEIANKQFYYWVELDAKTILDPNVVRICVDHFKAARPVAEFLYKAMH